MGRFAMIICPLCARSRKLVATRWIDPESSSKWDFWEEGSPIIQIREGGGKKSWKELTEAEREKLLTGEKKRGWFPGKGFKTIETLTLEEAIKHDEYKDIIKNMFRQIKRLYQIVQKYEKQI